MGDFKKSSQQLIERGGHHLICVQDYQLGGAGWLLRCGERTPSTTIAQAGLFCPQSSGRSCSWRRNMAIETQISTSILLCCSISSSGTRQAQKQVYPAQASARTCSSPAKICLKIFWYFPHTGHKLESNGSKCFPDYVPFIYRTGVKNENTFSVQKGRPGTSWHCPRLIWSLWLGADLLGLFSIPVFRLSQLQQSLRHVNCFMQRDNSVLWSQNRLWKLYVKLLKQCIFSLFE